jgi:hypothetical protein
LSFFVPGRPSERTHLGHGRYNAAIQLRGMLQFSQKGRKTMRRRDFITLVGAAVTAALTRDDVFAAQKSPISRIGFLALIPPPNTWLQYDLRALGWRDGENLQIEIRSSNAEIASLPRLAANSWRCGPTF